MRFLPNDSGHVLLKIRCSRVCQWREYLYFKLASFWRYPNQENCRKSNMKECIFKYIALHLNADSTKTHSSRVDFQRINKTNGRRYLQNYTFIEKKALLLFNTYYIHIIKFIAVYQKNLLVWYAYISVNKLLIFSNYFSVFIFIFLLQKFPLQQQKRGKWWAIHT